MVAVGGYLTALQKAARWVWRPGFNLDNLVKVDGKCEHTRVWSRCFLSSKGDFLSFSYI